MSDGSGAAPGGHDRPDLGGRLLDVVLYGPAGLVVTVAEHGPELVERGRAQLESRIASARSVGELAVRFGRVELRRRADELFGGSGGRSGRPDPVGAPMGPLRSVGGRQDSQDSRDSTRDVPTPDGGQGVSGAPGGRGSGVPPVTSLGIPGFDTLSASQVVQRLDGLSRSELVAVRAYEAHGRGRRTVLNRIDQLMDERA